MQFLNFKFVIDESEIRSLGWPCLQVLDVNKDGVNTVKLFVPSANGGQSLANILITQGKAEKKAIKSKRKKAPREEINHTHALCFTH